jgi:hypothetical protein
MPRARNWSATIVARACSGSPAGSRAEPVIASRIRRTTGPARSASDQDGEGDAAAEGAGDVEGAVEGAAEPDAAGDPLGPADDDGAAEVETAGEALAGVLSEGSGDGVAVNRPPWPATNP